MLPRTRFRSDMLLDVPIEVNLYSEKVILFGYCDYLLLKILP